MQPTAHTFCTCGETQVHHVARRLTADGFRVALWSDGAVTGALNNALPSVPVARPTTREAWEREIAAGWLFADFVELYDLDETPALHKAARAVARAGGGRAELQQRMAEGDRPTLRFAWQTYATDNRGDVTARWARLDRIRFPGLVVWHEHGRYELLMQVRRYGNGHIAEVQEPTGFVFTSQRELIDHLFKHQMQGARRGS